MIGRKTLARKDTAKCKKQLDLLDAMSVKKARVLKCRTLKTLCNEIVSGSHRFVPHIEARWISRGKMLHYILKNKIGKGGVIGGHFGQIYHTHVTLGFCNRGKVHKFCVFEIIVPANLCLRNRTCAER
jgi:hypothetical protein